MRHPLFPTSATLLALSCFLHTTAAKADTFLFTASSPTTTFNSAVTVTATLTGAADPTLAGAFDLTGGSGTWNSAPITLYLPSGTATSFQTANFTSPPFTYSSTYEYDNVVYTSGNNGLALDEYGLLFSSAGDHFNPYIQGSNYAYSDDEIMNGFNGPLYTVTLTDLGPSPVAATPEPASIALLGTGLLGVAGILRRRRSI